MEHQILRQVLLQAHSERGRILENWNLVFDKFGSGKTDDAINALRKSRDTAFNETARENGVLDYPFVFFALQSRGNH